MKGLGLLVSQRRLPNSTPPPMVLYRLALHTIFLTHNALSDCCLPLLSDEVVAPSTRDTGTYEAIVYRDMEGCYG